MSASAAPSEDAVLQRLSTLDRFLPVWIGLAMAAGLGLGALVPGLDDAFDQLAVGTVSLPIAVGLLLMMYPVLAKVRYERLGRLKGERGLFGASLALNWLVGPALMFALAWLALLVAINSLFQIAAYSLLGWFYLTVLPGWLGLDSQGIDISIWEVARTVLIFLGIPLVAGYLTRRIGVRRRGAAWYEQRFLPRIGPLALYGLLFTIVMLFAIQGDAITSQPLVVARIALPLLVYFAVMFTASFALGRLIGLTYPRTATLAFTAAGNNFELAIAVAVGVFGVTSGQALAGVVGPLIEVPALVGLVYVAIWLGRRWFGEHESAEHAIVALHPAETTEP